jgi:tRNA (cytidine32/guanosine34-2'-O)-methyltransferase
VTATLRPGGTFIAKIFRGKDISLLYSQLTAFFRDVTVAKPKSSRNSSVEAFVVCRLYAPPIDFRPSALRNVLQSIEAGYPEAQNTSEMRKLVPFIACGDLGGWDADASYELPDVVDGYTPLPPVQPPTAPAYKVALEKARVGFQV